MLTTAASPTASNDAALMAQLAAGKKSALAELYDRHSSTMLALARRILLSAEESEDLLHHVFVEVMRDANRYDPTRGTVRTWLITKTRSRALDRVRSTRRQRELTAERYASSQSEEKAFELSDRLAVRMMLGRLPLHMRTVLELAYFEGRTAVEISQKLDVPVGTVKSRLSRATTKLRELVN